MMDDDGFHDDGGADQNVIAFPAAEPMVEEADPRECPPELLVPALEACLFGVGTPVSATALSAALGATEADVIAGLGLLRDRQLRTGSGIRLVEVGEGWQLRSEARLSVWVSALRGGKPFRLSRPALEALAVVAFRQPVSKGAVDDIRGVDSGGMLRSLLDRGLVRMAGRSDEPGRPMLYGTTPAFLTLFGMRSLADLPTLRDLRALRDDAPEAATVPVVPFPGSEDGG
ncbi:MAG: SMC-Scp complex subunit ScpB [Myxococcales bacterium]|nr:SMC-Scp complex subunit ScpB [Myxococcales bacterium]